MTIGLYLTYPSFVGIEDKNNNLLMKLVIGFIMFRTNEKFRWASLTDFPIITFTANNQGDQLIFALCMVMITIVKVDVIVSKVQDYMSCKPASPSQYSRT